MGVRGLQTFIENQCPDACQRVSISQMLADHPQINGQCPVLVVDGMCLTNRLYSQGNGLEWIYGGQWTQFMQKIKNFIEKFHRIGVELVFFFDGTVNESKRKEWVRRRLEKQQQIISLFESIDAKCFKEYENQSMLPTSFGLMTRFGIKEMGVEVYQTDTDADIVIAKYAIENDRVIGILSQDSDFIIFNTKPYLSITHLDLDTLNTILYDRNCFSRKYLNLQVSQLPLFACLCGNDIVPPESLRTFHRRSLNRGGRIYLSDVAKTLSDLINVKQWRGSYQDRREMDDISSSVFGSTHQSRLFHDGLKSYELKFETNTPKFSVGLSPDFARMIHANHLNCNHPPYIFNLLCNLEFESSEVLENSTVPCPAALVFRPIRERCYAILFKSNAGVRVKEWCAYFGNIMNEPEIVLPVPVISGKELLCAAANIEDVWFRFSTGDRLQLFHATLGIKIPLDLLHPLPRPQFVLCCILNYIIEFQSRTVLIEPLGVAAFIAQAAWEKSVDMLERLERPPIEAHAVYLASLFMRGVSALLLCLGVCNFPFPITECMPWHIFDGKLFHSIYACGREMPNLMKMCHCQDNIVQKFYKLLSISTTNTKYDVEHYDWKSVLHDFDYSDFRNSLKIAN